MLRYLISTATAITLAGAINLYGQEQAPPPPQDKPAAETTTLTGCVIEAKTTDGGTAYVLNKVSGATDAMYVLTGPPPTELATHVNHKVEVTGKVQPPNPPAEGASANPKAVRPPLVIVDSVKMVADKCE